MRQYELLLQNYFNISCFHQALYYSRYSTHRILLITNYTRYKRIWYGMFQSQFTLNRFYGTHFRLFFNLSMSNLTRHRFIISNVRSRCYQASSRSEIKEMISKLAPLKYNVSKLSLILTTLTTNLTRTYINGKPQK